MQTFRFLDWRVYQDSKLLFFDILQLTKKLKASHDFEISNQLVRSTLSISLNIAEGSGKHSDKELNRFFNIAIGSINETVAIIDILHHNKLITEQEFKTFTEKLGKIANQLGGFKKKLKSL